MAYTGDDEIAFIVGGAASHEHGVVCSVAKVLHIASREVAGATVRQ